MLGIVSLSPTVMATGVTPDDERNFRVEGSLQRSCIGLVDLYPVPNVTRQSAPVPRIASFESAR
jgi:hypothetical protein